VWLEQAVSATDKIPYLYLGSDVLVQCSTRPPESLLLQCFGAAQPKALYTIWASLRNGLGITELLPETATSIVGTAAAGDAILSGIPPEDRLPLMLDSIRRSNTPRLQVSLPRLVEVGLDHTKGMKETGGCDVTGIAMAMGLKAESELGKTVVKAEATLTTALERQQAKLRARRRAIGLLEFELLSQSALLEMESKRHRGLCDDHGEENLEQDAEEASDKPVRSYHRRPTWEQ